MGLRSGDRFGRWTMVTHLGAGGNGEVWEVRDAEGQRAALKILTSRGGRYRLARFREEISFLIAHAGYPGVLPLIDSELHDDPAKRSWYVMPIATPIREALGHDPRPKDVVEACAAIAETLATLAADGVGHRDIKPDNLFQLGAEWLIGDFGLVSYPEKEPLTQHGRKLGPIEYLAPEMRNDADNARPEPADVWAFCKTLWVLLCDEVWPLPGPHRPGDPAYALSERISFDRAGELDLLLERATRIDPDSRESMDGVARELRACLAPPPEVVDSSNIAELQARIAALTNTEYERASQSQNWTRRVDALYSELEALLRAEYVLLAELLPSFSRDRNAGRWPDRLRRPGEPSTWGAWSQSYALRSPGNTQVAAVLTIATDIQRANGPIDIAAELRVERDHGGLVDACTVWTELYTAPIDSAQQSRALAAIRVGFRAAFGDAMRWIAGKLATHEPTL